MKRKPLAWEQLSSPLKKKINMQTPVGKAMVSVFRNSEEYFLLEFFETGATFNSEPYVR
jgi:hypothetical protein